MKLRIKGLEKKESDNVLRALWHCLGETNEAIQNEPDQCGQMIREIVADSTEVDVYVSMLHRITLHVYGSTLLRHVNKLGALVLIGDGECPECGSNEVTRGYYGVCQHCGHKWTRDDDDYLIPDM